MKPSSAKAKGRRHQQRIRDDLLKTFSHLSEDDVRSTSMGASGEDILLSARAQQDIPLSIEAKNCERLNIWSAIDQCKTNCPKTRHPCIVFTRNHETIYAAVPWSYFIELLSKSKHATPVDLQGRVQMAIDTLTELQSVIPPSQTTTPSPPPHES